MFSKYFFGLALTKKMFKQQFDKYAANYISQQKISQNGICITETV